MIDRKELVEKIASAIWNAAGMDWRPQDFSKASKDERERCLRAADAALTVAIDDLLRSPLFHRGGSAAIAIINEDLANRRAQLERVKTPEERVTVTEGGTYTHAIWIVMRDGENVLHMLKANYSREDAEIYRLGLIQQLKGSA